MNALNTKNKASLSIRGIPMPTATEMTVAKLYMRLFPKARFRIYSMLGRLLAADIDARSALEFIYSVMSSDGKRPGEFEAVAVAAWFNAFKEHGRIAESVAGWVPQNEILLLEAGERSGKFQQALTVMLRLNEKMSSIRGMIIGKLAYPVVTGVLLCGVLHFMATDLIPPMVEMKGGPGLFTGSASTVVSLMAWVKDWMIPTGIGIVALIVVTLATLSRFRGPFRAYFDKFPPWATHKFMSGTTFLSAILVLMESGRGLVDSIALVKPNASPYLSQKLERIHGELLEGAEFGEALAAGSDSFPDDELIKEIQIYGRIGRLDDGLLAVVEQWMETATAKTATQISFVGMIIMALSFAAIGLVFTGLYDIIGQLKQGQ